MKKKFLLLLGSATIVRLILISFVGLINDEAYYWVWSRKLALSYYDHPPVIAFVIRFFTEMLGNNSFAVHFSGLFFMTVFIVLLYAWAREMFSEREALMGTVVVLLTPLLFLGGLVITPDAILSFFWVLTLYAVFRALRSRKSFYWYLAGVSAGIGAITKYSILFLPVAIFLYLIFSKEDRWWLKRKEPYLSFLLMVLLFTPVLAWNAANGWASFSFHLVSRHNVSFSIVRFLKFIVSQMLHISPVVYIYGWISFYLLFIKGFRENNRVYRYLFFTSFPLVAGFSLSTFYTDALSHWPVFGYLGGLVALPALMKSWKKNTIPMLSIGLSIIIITVFTMQVIYPVINIKKDPTDDVHGWDEVGRQAVEVYSKLPGKSFLLCDRYETGGQLSFAAKMEVMVLHPERIMAYKFWQNEEELKGRDALYLTHSRHYCPPKNIYKFRKTTLVREIPLYRAGRKVRTFMLYHCQDYQGLKRP